jgi:hypothetical protein
MITTQDIRFYPGSPMMKEFISKHVGLEYGEPGPHASRHIEAALLLAPIPTSYVSYCYGEDHDYKFIVPNPVIDSLYAYMNDKFRVETDLIKPINGKLFSELEYHVQRRFNEVYTKTEMLMVPHHDVEVIEWARKFLQK